VIATVELLQQLADKDILINSVSGELKIKAPKGAVTAEVLREISEHKSDLLSYFENQGEAQVSNNNELLIAPVERKEGQEYPLSFAQTRMWFVDKLKGMTPEYNMPVALRVSGDFDLEAAGKAIEFIIDKHEILRANFVEQLNGPCIKIRNSKAFNFKIHDLTAYADKEVTVSELLLSDQTTPFNLVSDSLFRASFIILERSERDLDGILLFNTHHIISDGWSLGVMIREFVSNYLAIKEKAPMSNSNTEIQYIDFVSWQQAQLSIDSIQKQKDYWRSHLDDLPAVHSLPVDFSKRGNENQPQEAIKRSIPNAISARVIEAASEYGMTPFMLLHALLSIVISRSSASHDVVLGTPAANRNATQLESMIGLFVNTLILRVNTDFSSLKEYLASVKKINIDAFSNQDVPLETLIEELAVNRNAEHSPLFQIMFSLNNVEIGGISIPEISIEPLERERSYSKFDLDISAQIGDEGIQLVWDFDPNVFKPETVSIFADAFAYLLTEFSKVPPNSDLLLSELACYPQGVYLEEVSESLPNLPTDTTVCSLFEKQVLKTPESIALICEDNKSESRVLNYHELNTKIECLFNELKQIGVREDDLIGVCLSRTPEMIISLLAIIKIGATYVPLSSEVPAERINEIVLETGLRLCITDGESNKNIKPSTTHSVSFFNCTSIETLKVAKFKRCDNLNEALNADTNLKDLAYVIFTSGSTGKPKGVKISQSAFTLFLLSMKRRLEIESKSDLKLLALTTITFDISGLELFLPLISGGQLILANDQQSKEPKEISQLLNKYEINFLQATPATWKGLINDEWNGNRKLTALCGGEAMSKELAHALRHKCKTVWNCYGPTEATVWSLVSKVEDNPREIAIKNSLSGYQHFVLDNHGQFASPGTLGELCISGTGLSEGYWNNQLLTDEKFITKKIGDKAIRLYRTGDLVKQVALDEYKFQGRTDDQVKVRGFRIELEEVNKVILTSEYISDSAVITRNSADGEKYLAAYIIASAKNPSINTEPNFPENEVSSQIENNQSLSVPEKVKRHVERFLPSYMVPNTFTMIKSMPTTSSGKINRALLSNFEDTNFARYKEPVTEIEKQVQLSWQLTLKREKISVDSDFFSLGGHSLLAVSLINDINSRTGLELKVRDIFDYSTIEKLSHYIAKIRDNKISIDGKEGAENGAEQYLSDENSVAVCELTEAKRRRELNGKNVLSYGQERMLFIDSLDGGSSQYNMPVTLRIDGLVDFELVEAALSSIVNKHEVLKTIYKQVEGEYCGSLTNKKFHLERMEMSQDSTSNRSESILALVSDLSAQPFDLSNDLMLKAYLLVVDEDLPQSVLLVNCHHIAADGWSLQILIKEFMQIYGSLSQDKAIEAKSLPFQYADFAELQKSDKQTRLLDKALQEWQTILSDAPARHQLPVKGLRPEVKSHVGKKVDVTIDSQLTKKLLVLAQRKKMSPFMLLNAALAVVISSHSYETDIVVGTPVANRPHKAQEGVVGFFVNLLALRTSTDFNLVDDFLDHVREVNLKAQSLQSVPFELLVERLNLPRNTSHTPLFQVMLSLDNLEANALELPNAEVSFLEVDAVVAKYDLELSAMLTEQGMSFSWIYDSALFDEVWVKNLSRHFGNVLQAFIDNSKTQMSEITLLSAREKSQTQITHSVPLSDKSSNLHKLYEFIDSNVTIHQYFESISNAYLNSPAVSVVASNFKPTVESNSLSYKQLNNISNQLSHYLSKQGAKPYDRIAISITNNELSIIAIMAVLKLGAAYLPLDPSYPIARRQYMIDDAGANLVLSVLNCRAEVKQLQVDSIIELDDVEVQKDIGKCPVNNYVPIVQKAVREKREPIAYVIYTSGTTGKPKGIEISHKNWLSYLKAAQKSYDISPGQRVVQFSSISFDIFIEELSLSILSSNELIICPQISKATPKEFWQFIKQYSITVCSIPTAYWHELSSDPQLRHDQSESPLNYVIVGGESMSLSHLKRWSNETSNPVKLFNTYGPTETTIVATAYDCSKLKSHQQIVPIGAPLPGYQLLVLDRNLNPAPIGAVGELCVGGDAVSPGYINNKSLTDSKFINCPHGNIPSQRLYRTGDLVRVLECNNLEFVRRIDQQTKIRGYRVELSEISNKIEENDSVHSSKVTIHESKNGLRRIVAYVRRLEASYQTEVEFISSIKDHLRLELPDYMQPSAVVSMDTWPLTPSGKVDEKQLPEPDFSIGMKFVPPTSDAELTLAKIWCELLDIPSQKISIEADFFEMGGHSLLALKLINRVSDAFGLENSVGVKEVFSFPTIAQMGLQVELALIQMKNQNIKENIEQMETFEEGEI